MAFLRLLVPTTSKLICLELKMNPEGLQVVQDAEVISEKRAGTTDCPLMVETERFKKENNDPPAS